MTTPSNAILRNSTIAIVILASLAAYGFLSIVVPKLTQDLLQQRKAIPRPTQALIAVSELTVQYWWVLASAVALTVLAIARAFRSRPRWLETVFNFLNRNRSRCVAAGVGLCVLFMALAAGALLLPMLQIG